MQDESRVTVDHAGHVVKCAADVDVRDVNVPVSMRGIRLVEAFTFGFRLGGFASQQVRCA